MHHIHKRDKIRIPGAIADLSKITSSYMVIRFKILPCSDYGFAALKVQLYRASLNRSGV